MPTSESERLIRLFAQEVPEIAAGTSKSKRLPAKAESAASWRCSVVSPKSMPSAPASGSVVAEFLRSSINVDGERIDLILWDDSPEKLIANALQPALSSKEATTMKRITRNRSLTPDEATKYKAIRELVVKELPDLVARHHERMATLDQLDELLKQLKAAREAKGLSLADVTELTGMDRSALSKLETGQRANPTVETLVRYAEAVGKRLVVSLTDG
jgi:DNA-binding XRE family transcriptional regulator